jgi:RNA polymerase sigma factor FliA
MSSMPSIQENLKGTLGPRKRVRRSQRSACACGAPTTPVAQPPVTKGESGVKEWPEPAELAGMLLWVKRLVWKMRGSFPPHVEADDLVGEGLLGLVDALKKFDASKHVKLQSYARHRINGSILDGLRALDPASRQLRKYHRRVDKVYHQLQGQLGRAISDEEMARALGMSLPQWLATQQDLQAVGFDWQARQVSVQPSAKIDNGNSNIEKAPNFDLSFSNFHASPTEDPFEQCYRQEQRRLLDRALTSLPERQRTIIILHDLQEVPMKEIASRLKVDASRVSQLHAEAVLGLKRRVQALLQRPLPAPPNGRQIEVGNNA